jgi:hypothetical protein
MATIIVSSSGAAGAPGSLAAPVQTLAQALALAKPGDTIMLREGEYAGGVTVSQPDITIKSFPGEKAVISCGIDNGSPEWVIRFGPNAHGGTLDGLEIKGGSYYAVKLESTWDWGGRFSAGRRTQRHHPELRPARQRARCHQGYAGLRWPADPQQRDLQLRPP